MKNCKTRSKAEPRFPSPHTTSTVLAGGLTSRSTPPIALPRRSSLSCPRRKRKTRHFVLPKRRDFGMAWLWILLFFTWVASLLVILFLPWGNSGVRFGSKQGAKGIAQMRNVLLVIAHPDDESMFFTPTVLCLISARHAVHVLCISTGDAEGKGTLRKNELYQACVILKVQLHRVKIIDHPDLQDGFGKSWSPVLIKDLIEEAVIAWEIDTVITFDNYGISGHRNHQDVHTGLRMLMMSNLQSDIEAWELVSTNIARKYCGPVDVWWSIFESYFCQKEEICFLPNKSPCLSANAMAQHSSQWVWFRRLFVVFSRYTYMNTLRKIRS
ncbi:uncharacterized protein LOC116259782 isoform X2 [Nymphaea colorata]|uniref:uncharacterized protein LOC116259782 isoform X2 n=1 Tax=Nymphaea colorata TaxID=210225 RepID=UPI00129EA6D8|nr:uncharacterized protein LOC116259782 isoform X2 [Nymphaea colorata]